MSLIRSKLEDHRCIRFDMILSVQKYLKQKDTYIVLEAHKSYNSTWYGTSHYGQLRNHETEDQYYSHGGQAPGGHTVIYGPFG
ncbi:unnamed protein product, partial [Brassica napus]